MIFSAKRNAEYHQKTFRSFNDTPHGPSGEAQTLGLAVPNRAFYQLNYTRIFSFCHYTTLGVKIKDFPVCGHSCGQGRFSARFCKPVKSRKRPCCKAFRASAVAIVDGDGNTPKAGAVPTPLHPVVKLDYPAGRILPNQTRYHLRYTRIFTFPILLILSVKSRGS